MSTDSAESGIQTEMFWVPSWLTMTDKSQITNYSEVGKLDWP